MKQPLRVTSPSLSNLRRNRLAQAISLILAGIFGLQIIEAEAEDAVISAGPAELNQPSQASLEIELQPSYLDIAMQAVRSAPMVFGAPAPITVSTNGGAGITGAGVHDEATVNLAAANSTGVKADGGVIEFNQGEVKSGAISTATAKGQTGLSATNGGEIRGAGITVDMSPKTAASVAINATDMTGALATQGGILTLEDTAILMGGGVSGLNNRGLVSIGGIVDFSGGAISTLSKGSVAVQAMDGGQIVLRNGTTVTTTGNSGTTQASHGLLAQNGGQIVADGIQVTTSGSAASAARADGGSMQLSNSALSVNGAATSTTTTAVIHAQNGGQVSGSGLTLNSAGNYVGGVRAEGAGSQVSLENSSVQVDGAGVVGNPSAAARAMAGASVVIKQSDLLAKGTYGHGVSVEGAGSTALISHSNVTTQGARSTGLNITAGGAADMRNSSVRVEGNVGPAGPGVLVENAGSTLSMSDSDITTTQKSSYGVRALDSAVVDIRGGKVDTAGDYSAGISAAQSSVTATDVTVHTSGNENAMGVVADLGATVTLNGGSVTTTGNGSPVASNLTYAHGLVSRNAGALLVANGTSVHTTGSQSYGAAVDDGGSMILNNLAVKTEGATSRGLYAGIGAAKPGAVSLVGNNISVETLGSNAAGAFVSRKFKDESAELTLNNSSVVTHGALSYALQAESGATLNANHSVVSSDGSGAHGALANSQGTQMNLDQVAISASGDNAHGALVKNGAQLDGSHVQLSASGAQSAALATQAEVGSESRVHIDQGVLNNHSGATVDVSGAASIALEHVLAGGSGQWLNVDRSVTDAGLANLELKSSLVSGSAKTASGSTANLSMRDTSLWQLTGDSNLSSLRNDASLIDFSAPLGGAFKRLTVHDYHGANGTIALNTHLYDDASPSDRVVIDGGKATGSSNLAIRNAGGAGALTTGNGIMVVDAVNGGGTEQGAFRLLNQVKAGPYEYLLYRGSRDDSNADAWYLRSTIEPDDPGWPEKEKPNYRVETSLYSAVPEMALRYSHALLDTLHERVGEERRLSTDPLPTEEVDEYGPSLGWGRVIYQVGEAGGRDEGAASFDYDVNAFQVGLDLYRNEDVDGSLDIAGLSFASGKMYGSVEHGDGRDAGHDRLRAHSLGGYWTHFGPEGWYVDGVLQFSTFDIESDSADDQHLETDGRGITASLEAGYPFEVDDDLFVEPQAQVIVSRIELDDSHDGAADVRFEDVDSLAARLGLRIAQDWFDEDDGGDIRRTTAWIRPSIWHEFKGQPQTEFSSASGYVPFTSDMSGTTGEINLGIDHQVDDNTTFTFSAGYQQGFDDDSSGYEGIIGVKVDF
ncbi:autotransporter outer membrane beta-barrel domain-containing protein [Aquipseudomonas alcaligenes]|uniref:autotransporter outer membrane beta-barrel domain-containing protein n=1 Tax=Aquipseudomonas alcaligenes TaxID=43263 RepID=UPI003749C4FC